jgi:hypothetical protein
VEHRCKDGDWSFHCDRVLLFALFLPDFPRVKRTVDSVSAEGFVHQGVHLWYEFAACSGSPISWQWDFSSGWGVAQSSTRKSPQVWFNKPKNYTVRLDVSFADGATRIKMMPDYLMFRR